MTGERPASDYGLLRDLSAARAEAERGAAHAVRAGDAAALKSALVTGAYLPSDRAELSTTTWR